jgi:hypothetical protein
MSASPPRALSEVLATLEGRPDAARLSLGDLTDAMGPASIPALLLVIALPAILTPPVAAAVFGAPMLLLSTQLAAGRRAPWLPGSFRRIAVRGPRATGRVVRLVAAARQVERLVRPRAGLLLHPVHVRLVAGACMALSTVLLTPAPVAHSAAGLGVVAFSAGLLRRDGLALLCGWALTLACAALLALVVAGAVGVTRLL